MISARAWPDHPSWVREFIWVLKQKAVRLRGETVAGFSALWRAHPKDRETFAASDNDACDESSRQKHHWSVTSAWRYALATIAALEKMKAIILIHTDHNEEH